MKTVFKVLSSILVGICLICIGISIGGIDQLHSVSFINNLDLRIQAQPIASIEQDMGYIRDLKIDITKANLSIHEDASLTSVKVQATHLYEGFQIKQNNDELIIEQPCYWFKRYDSHTAQIDIYIPKGYTFDNIKLEAGTGKSSIYNLKANDIKIDTGMGDVYFENIKCQKLDLDTGMARTDVRYVECQEKLKVDVGMGSVTMDVQGQESDFDYKINVGLGSVKIGNQKFSGIADHQSYQQGKSLIDVSCSVDIRLEE